MILLLIILFEETIWSLENKEGAKNISVEGGLIPKISLLVIALLLVPDNVVPEPPNETKVTTLDEGKEPEHDT